jgi:class 3 adenylate cyclase
MADGRNRARGEQTEDRRLSFRIGVNLGDVIVEGDDIYGDGVDVSARLEALAEPGGIRVSCTVVNHVRGKVASGFEDLGEQEVKNLPEPVHAFRVLMEPSARSNAVAPITLPAGKYENLRHRSAGHPKTTR